MTQELPDENSTLGAIQRLFIDKKRAFVSYRLPYAREVTTILQWTAEPEFIYDLNLLNNKTGFIFAPFIKKRQTPVRLIIPDFIIEGEDPRSVQHIFRLAESLQADSDIGQTCEPKKNSTSYKDYFNQVENFKSITEASKLGKIVLSRISVDPIPENFNPSEFFKGIHIAYPHAFVFMLYIRDTGLWIGASPEQLIQVRGSMAGTVSLAGTRRVLNSSMDVPWQPKEYNEQMIVTNYIAEVLKRFGVVNYSLSGPKTFKAGQVEHLKTEFRFSIDNLQKSVFEFIEYLHPTPSVCGWPKDKALSYIKQAETHDREYYSGFLGPLNNKEGELNLFVNLRCLKAEKTNLLYFMGAGITSGSIPDKEWEETESKKNTLKVILNNLFP